MKARSVISTFKIALIVLALWLIGWLLIKNLVPGGRFEAVYNFQNTPFISALRPPERLSEFPRGEATKEQSIVGDPVYFDLRLPSSFQDVEITILYRNPNNQKFTVSAFTDRANWKFMTPTPSIFPISKGEDQGGGELLEYRANFSTAGLDIARRTITFILGAPAATQENPVTIDEIKLIAAKEPTSWRHLPAKVIKILYSKF